MEQTSKNISNDSLNDDDLENVKGDAIGNTMFSERFVLSTLLSLNSIEECLDKNIEKDLCILWDMTVERDVVILLLEHKVLDIFVSLIKKTDDRRLTEIIIGIIANMCAVEETRNEIILNSSIAPTVLSLISCTDTLVLIQLMRFIEAVSIFDNTAKQSLWLTHLDSVINFVEDFSFILSTSLNLELLQSTLNTLAKILSIISHIERDPYNSEKSFINIFVKSYLIEGVNDAFLELVSKNDIFDEFYAVPKNILKLFDIFFYNHYFLLEYDLSLKVYESSMPKFLKCLSFILTPLSESKYLLPLDETNCGYIETITDIFEKLNDPFCGKCFVKLVTIWNILHCDIQKLNFNENSEVEEIPKNNFACELILKYLLRTILKIPTSKISNSLKTIETKTAIEILYYLRKNKTEIFDKCSDIIKSLETSKI